MATVTKAEALRRSAAVQAENVALRAKVAELTASLEALAEQRKLDKDVAMASESLLPAWQRRAAHIAEQTIVAKPKRK